MDKETSSSHESSPKVKEPKPSSFLYRVRSFLPSRKLKGNENPSDSTENLTSDYKSTMGVDSSKATEKEGSTGQEQASSNTFTDKFKNFFSLGFKKSTDEQMLKQAMDLGEYYFSTGSEFSDTGTDTTDTNTNTTDEDGGSSFPLLGVQPGKEYECNENDNTPRYTHESDDENTLRARNCLSKLSELMRNEPDGKGDPDGNEDKVKELSNKDGRKKGELKEDTANNVESRNIKKNKDSED